MDKIDLMNRVTKLVGAATLVFLAQTSFACDYPTRVDIPNGDSASKEEMIAGQRDVKAFVASMEAYLDCLLEEEKAARAEAELSPEDEQQREEMVNKKYNAAVDEMEMVAARFNEQVQAFKARGE
ncbi:hypothetical protein [Woeseia oceani]|uniref:Uncharacterized protein n=1 Tax=Woeseia oceani TaxID=1548547 RepID=A0A193LCM5_9GAMM|nr:hypothetical protein [Woeseia oceani]ANO50218.1 hypothetical protein BA177_02380 [Woeseia oceani]